MLSAATGDTTILLLQLTLVSQDPGSIERDEEPGLMSQAGGGFRETSSEERKPLGLSFSGVEPGHL